MSQFRDSAGTLHNLRITVGTQRKIRDATGVDLYALFDEQMAGYAALMGDLPKFVSVLHVIAVPACTLDEFMDRFDGDSVEAAVRAFEEAVIEFFPQSRRPALTKLLATLRDLETTMRADAMETLEGLDVKAVAEAMTSSLVSGSGAASSEASTPIRIASAS